MNIELQHTGDLGAIIKVDVTSADYEEKVMKTLKDYQRKASMPGFRPGKVPFGLTKKMYGQAVTADVINNLINESLQNYIQEQKLNILGNPIPAEDEKSVADFNTEKDFSFSFEVGLAPEFDLKLDKSLDLKYYKIEISDEIAHKYLEDTRMREGELIEAAVAEKGDVIEVDFVELDASGEPKEGGIVGMNSISPELYKDEKVAAEFEGIKPGAVVKFNPLKASENASEVAGLLNIPKESAEQLESEFRFTVTAVKHREAAELNSDFFEKVYPGEEINTKETLIERIKKDASQSFVQESDRKFFNDAVKALIEKSGIALPEQFLKKWLIEINRDKQTPDYIEEHFAEYMKSMRWQLIENRLIQEFNIEVSDEEVKDVFRGYFRRPGSTELDEETKNRIDGIVETFMKNKEDVNRINDQLYEQKLMNLLKTEASPEEQVVSHEEFSKIVTEK